MLAVLRLKKSLNWGVRYELGNSGRGDGSQDELAFPKSRANLLKPSSTDLIDLLSA